MVVGSEVGWLVLTGLKVVGWPVIVGLYVGFFELVGLTVGWIVVAMDGLPVFTGLDVGWAVLVGLEECGRSVIDGSLKGALVLVGCILIVGSKVGSSGLGVCRLGSYVMIG